jgi:pimeloyl-ACP methyl ester carboxylesterase
VYGLTDVRWRTVDVSGARVELLEVGSGEPVLFLPGWGLTARSYIAALLPLASSGLRVIAPSLPGFGASTPLGLRAPLAAYARRIVALLDVLDPEHPVFATGHSFGAGVTLKMAHLRPDLIRSVTAVNPVGGAPDRRGLRKVSWLGWSLASSVAALPKSRPHAIDPRQLTRLAADLMPNVARRPIRALATGAVAITAQLADEARQLAATGMPVLYVWGDRDRLILPGQLQGMGGPESTETVAGGHGWVITHPQEFAETLHESLAVHALLELEQRGVAPAVAAATVARAITDPSKPLADVFPPERRHRARHKPPVKVLSAAAPLLTASQPPMGRG